MMDEIIDLLPLIYLIFLGAIAALFAYIGIVSWLENEKRAAKRAALLAVLIPSILSITFLLPDQYRIVPITILLVSILGFIALLFLPTYWIEKKLGYEVPVSQINEKTVMFSRRLLKPGTDQYRKYYEEFPEHEFADKNFRSKPGLLSETSTLYEPFTFKAADALFEAIKAFYPDIDGEPADKQARIDLKRMSTFIKNWILKEGVVSAGITELKDYHWYSLIGRGPDYGKEAQLPHEYGIAFTVEMDKDMMDQAPYGPTVMESARQYMHAAVIATAVAKFIRGLGYNARAHIDGNYRVVCPLVARDAGLGEIGRMGILMTPALGPRVRIGVVTTDMPLEVDAKRDLSYMIKFCSICKKCAHVCPSKSIAFDDRKLIDGVRRWQINQEKCFTYWCIVGTDCGKCMSDCPFSHPDNFFHNIVRRMIRYSSIFRRLALAMDDFFYGRKPKPLLVPKWIKNNTPLTKDPKS